MKIHPPVAQGPERLVQGEIAILLIAQHWMSGMRQMHPDLMGPARLDHRDDECRPVWRTRQFKMQQARHTGDRLPALLAHANTAIAIRRRQALKRRADGARSQGPAAGDDCEVGLSSRALAKLLLQAHKCRATGGDHEHTARFTVKPMDEFKEPCLGALAPQRLDRTQADAASSVDCESRRLVDHQERIVLVQDRQIRSACRRTAHCSVLRAHTADRRQPHPVALAQAQLGRSPPAIDSHLSAADQLIHMGAWNAPAVSRDKIIQSLALVLTINLD